MGVIAGSIVAYAQPLFDETDGSAADMQKAMTLAQICWNLALLPEKERDTELVALRQSFPMDDNEFEDFRRSLVLPMIRRHHEMFPHMSRLDSTRHSSAAPLPRAQPAAASPVEKCPGTGRNAPCPCHSGKKYKRCCGR